MNRGISAHRGRLAVLAGILALLSAAATASLPQQPGQRPAEPRQDPVEAGEFLFGIYCQSCHGETAQGDGPVAAELKVPPADLTRISERNGGEFPFERVHRRIDGRSEVGAHGPSDMPVWGFTFQQRDSDSNQEAEVHDRIHQIVKYLESIQVREGD